MNMKLQMTVLLLRLLDQRTEWRASRVLACAELAFSDLAQQEHLNWDSPYEELKSSLLSSKSFKAGVDSMQRECFGHPLLPEELEDVLSRNGEFEKILLDLLRYRAMFQ